MKFFTFHGWSGLQTPEATACADPGRAYREHLSRIRERLPADLLRLEEDVSIHDARVDRLTLDPADALLTLELRGDDGKGGPRRFSLEYSGVRRFDSLTHKNRSLPGPGGYGDLGCWEIDLVRDGFEHRLLFSSGIEIHIEFKGFRLDFSDDDVAIDAGDRK